MLWHSILVCSILLYYILVCYVLLCSVRAYAILFCSVLFCSILFYFIHLLYSIREIHSPGIHIGNRPGTELDQGFQA